MITAVEFRRQLHRHPELSFEEHATAKDTFTKADGTAFGDAAWNLGYFGGKGGKGSGKLDVEIRNVVATLPESAKAEVSFDLNYAGATGAPESMQVTEGNAYGTLPTPTREGYTFGGWYTDAACSGNAVEATTTVSASHILYAKWTKNTTEEPEGSILVAVTPDDLVEATSEQKTAAGVDPAQKMYASTEGIYNTIEIGCNSHFSNFVDLEVGVMIDYDGRGWGTRQYIALNIELWPIKFKNK